MYFGVLLLLGTAFGWALYDFFDDNDSVAASEDVPPPAGEEPRAGDDSIIFVTDRMLDMGSDSSNAYLFDPAATGSIAATIDAGGGDDIINLAGLFDRASLNGAQLSGGDGNDTISAVAGSSTISGGAGDDRISVEASRSSILGDDGADFIRVINSDADQTTVDGGAGNDTLDGTGSNNVRLSGGAGDDVILTDGHVPGGTGFVIGADGGAGNDTLTHTVEVFPLVPQDQNVAGATMTGGEGADRFEIVLTAGLGSFTASPNDPTVFVNEAAFITDFARGIDQIDIDLSDFLSGYTAESGTLTENTAAGSTEILIRLASDSTLPDQDVRIVVAATGLSWSDVSFTGPPPGNLLVA